VMLAGFLPIHGDGAFAVLVPACIGLVLVGFGIGLPWPHLVTRVFQVAPPGERDLAAGAITTVQLFITALGTAAAGMAANFAGLSDPGGVPGAQSAALWLFVAFAMVSVLGIPIAIAVARMSRQMDGRAKRYGA
jgi:MFS family permease